MIQSKRADDIIDDRFFYSEHHNQALIYIKDAINTVELAEEDIKNKALKAFCRSCIKYRSSDGLCLDSYCEDCPMPSTYCEKCADAKIADDHMCCRKKKFVEQLNEIQ